MAEYKKITRPLGTYEIKVNSKYVIGWDKTTGMLYLADSDCGQGYSEVDRDIIMHYIKYKYAYGYCKVRTLPDEKRYIPVSKEEGYRHRIFRKRYIYDELKWLMDFHCEDMSYWSIKESGEWCLSDTMKDIKVDEVINVYDDKTDDVKTLGSSQLMFVVNKSKHKINFAIERLDYLIDKRMTDSLDLTKLYDVVIPLTDDSVNEVYHYMGKHCKSMSYSEIREWIKKKYRDLSD